MALVDPNNQYEEQTPPQSALAPTDDAATGTPQAEGPAVPQQAGEPEAPNTVSAVPDDAAEKAAAEKAAAEEQARNKAEDDAAVLGFNQQADIIRQEAEKYRPEDAETKKKREKRERRNRLWSAIGDGMMSLSNLVFTSLGAPNMYNHEKMSQQAANKAREDAAKKERDSRDETWTAYQLKLGDLETKKAETLREINAKRAAQKLAQQKQQQDADKFAWEKSLWPYIQQTKQATANKAAADATTAEARADEAPGYYSAKTNTEVQRGQTERTKQGANRSATDLNRARARSVDAGTTTETEETSSKEVPTKDRRGRVTGTATETTTRRKTVTRRPAGSTRSSSNNGYKNTKALGL